MICMKLIKLQPSEDKTLITCHLCGENISRHLARGKGWVVDFPDERSAGNFYCVECQSFLINKLDMH